MSSPRACGRGGEGPSPCWASWAVQPGAVPAGAPSARRGGIAGGPAVGPVSRWLLAEDPRWDRWTPESLQACPAPKSRRPSPQKPATPVILCRGGDAIGRPALGLRTAPSPQQLPARRTPANPVSRATSWPSPWTSASRCSGSAGPRGANTHGQGRLAYIQPGHPVEQHLHLAPLPFDNHEATGGPLTGAKPTRSQQESNAPEGPRAIHLTRLHAPMRPDVASRRQQCPRRTHPPTQRSRSPSITPSASAASRTDGDELLGACVGHRPMSRRSSPATGKPAPHRARGEQARPATAVPASPSSS